MNELVTIQCGSPDAIDTYTAAIPDGPARHKWMLEVELYNLRAEMGALEDLAAHIRGTIEHLKGAQP